MTLKHRHIAFPRLVPFIFALRLVCSSQVIPPTAKVTVKSTPLKDTLESPVLPANETAPFFNVNAHLTEGDILKELPNQDWVTPNESIKFPVIFESIQSIVLSKAEFKVSSYLSFAPYRQMFNKLILYLTEIEDQITTFLAHDTYPPYSQTDETRAPTQIDQAQTTFYKGILQDHLIEIKSLMTHIIDLQSRFNSMLEANNDDMASLHEESLKNRKKRSLISSIFKFIFGGSGGTSETIKQLKRNVHILMENQHIQNSQIKELFEVSNLNRVEIGQNRRLLKSLVKELIQINHTTEFLQYTDTLLFATVQFLGSIIQTRHKLAMIRDTVNSLSQNIHHLNTYFRALGSNKLSPEMVPLNDLFELLTDVRQDLVGHPKLQLPDLLDVNHLYKYYRYMRIEAVLVSDMLLCVLQIPLVDRTKRFQVYKIHNLPLPIPQLKKQLHYVLHHEHLALTTDRLYVTYPSASEILSCQISSGAFCEINSAIYPVSTSQTCEHSLFIKDEAGIEVNCKVTLHNFTHPMALSLNHNFWAISSFVKSTLHIACLTKTYYQVLKVPLDIIYLPEGCEAFNNFLLIPAHNDLTKEISPRKLGLKIRQFKLRYSEINDFTAVKMLKLEKLSPEQLQKLVHQIPEISNVPFQTVNDTIQEINENYPYVMPDWLKMTLTILGTIVMIIIIVVICYLKHVQRIKLTKSCGCLPLFTSTTKKKSRDKSQLRRTPPSSLSISRPIQHIELQSSPEKSTTSLVPVPPLPPIRETSGEEDHELLASSQAALMYGSQSNDPRTPVDPRESPRHYEFLPEPPSTPSNVRRPSARNSITPQDIEHELGRLLGAPFQKYRQGRMKRAQRNPKPTHFQMNETEM